MSEKISAMFKVEFDRPHDPALHYVSPGTIKLEFSDGTMIPFDFNESVIGFEDKIATIEENGLDIQSFPSSCLLNLYLSEKQVSKISLFIYTGERPEEQEIVPVRLLSFMISINRPEMNICFTLEDHLLQNAVLEY